MTAFHGFKIPVVGKVRRGQADVGLKNFARNPDTMLYQRMVDGTDTYRVVLVRKAVTLAYGANFTFGPLACSSQLDGMHCTNSETKAGFDINRTQYTLR